MKKYLLAFLILIPAILSAQSEKLSIGIEGGAGLASVRGPEQYMSNVSPKIGYTGGVYVQRKLNKQLSLRFGINYEIKGFKDLYFPLNSDSYGSNATENFKNLTFPLLLKFKSKNEDAKFFFTCGPYYSILLKQYPEYENYDGYFYNGTDKFHRSEFGCIFGFGWEIPVKKITLVFEIRDHLGISNVASETTSLGHIVRTNAAYALVGLKFKLCDCD